MQNEYPVEGLPTPDPSYDPAEVVRIQVEALADNDDPVPDAGIKTAYNFASPGNRANTGPLERFVAMVHDPTYSPMVDHTEATAGPLERDGNTARQRVTLTGPDGRTVTYEFGLSLHEREPFAGCWLTDSVLAV
jgi:hypothetical protein